MKLAILATLVLTALPAFAQTNNSSAELSANPQFPGLRVVCRARNLRGEVFREVGLFPGVVQERAMNSCRAFSAVCRPMGCERF